MRNEEECVCSVCLFRCNILIGFRIIKEMPGLVGCGTPYISHSDFAFLQIGLLVEKGKKFSFYPTRPEGISVGLCGRRGAGGAVAATLTKFSSFACSTQRLFRLSPTLFPTPPFPLELSSSRLSASVSLLFLSISLCHCQYSQWRAAVFLHYRKVELLLGYDS